MADVTDPEARLGTPLWVKVFGVIALVVLVLFVIVFITGGGAMHGPARHAP